MDSKDQWGTVANWLEFLKRFPADTVLTPEIMTDLQLFIFSKNKKKEAL